MALDSAELVQYARDAAARGDDLYALLGVDATTSKDDIHRAWRRAGLKYHPDKAGANYDPAKYEAFERARDVLCDPTARDAYDSSVRAALQKKRRIDEMSAERRRFVEELERAESEAKRRRTKGEEGNETDGISLAERSRVVEAGRRRMEERARLMREAEERSRQRESGVHGPATPTAAPVTPTPTPGRTRDAIPTRQPTGGGSPPPGGEDEPTPEPLSDADDYDRRIAELERRLREKQQKAASRKSEKKKSRKSDIGSLASHTVGVETPSARRAEPPHPDDRTAELGDHGDKVPPPRSFSFRSYAASAPSSPANTAKSGSCSTSLPQFAATMARLKAAQAKREEEKRRRAEAQATSEQVA
ncbi:hypothetical protein VTK73DRAFT_6651 [Phialemonium thermophilum]|uniref:J domain-containing protein n=1 Tax=Phialemonium thermophilum TaxID=223376 RepID=A0ABR3WIH6_9PEZI